jgi:hypothetical protein
MLYWVAISKAARISIRRKSKQQQGIPRDLSLFRSFKYLQLEMESFAGHQHPSDLVP